jgi:methyltransferase-like protein/SAM-dependent methyltransferase
MSIELLDKKLSTTNTYDEVPYESYPFYQSSPQNLRALGMLFGMDPVKLENARVLELGCASGFNIIPHAINYPNAKFIGVDLSEKQVNSGKAVISDLKLDNIELLHMSITDVTPELGMFDYIICHGVISWVPEFVQNKIFEISKKNLSPNGIAYISYNTLPGWNMIRSIRDMMLYHSNGFTDIKDKISQARLLLQFMNDALVETDTPYSEMLKSETELLSKQSDHYIRHDHLEEDNKQFYFSDFINIARSQGLQYLSDVHVSTMYLGNLPKAVADQLSTINDIVRVEQYVDFLTNRRFRSTLLCHDTVALTRAITNEDIKKFCLTFDIAPEKELSKDLLMSNEVVKFVYNRNPDNFISASSPALKAIFSVLSEYKHDPLQYDEVISLASKKIPTIDKNVIENDFVNNAMVLVMKGYITLSSSKNIIHSLKKTSKKNLEAIKIAHYQAKNPACSWVINSLHNIVAISAIERLLLEQLDGKNSKEDLKNKIFDAITSGLLSVQKNGQNVTNPTIINDDIEQAIEISIDKLKQSSLIL